MSADTDLEGVAHTVRGCNVYVWRFRSRKTVEAHGCSSTIKHVGLETDGFSEFPMVVLVNMEGASFECLAGAAEATALAVPYEVCVAGRARDSLSVLAMTRSP